MPQGPTTGTAAFSGARRGRKLLMQKQAPLSNQHEFFLDKCFPKTLRFAFCLYALVLSSWSWTSPAAALRPECWLQCWFPTRQTGLGGVQQGGEGSAAPQSGASSSSALSLQVLLICRTLAPALF